MAQARHLMRKASAIKAETTGREIILKLMEEGHSGLPIVNDQSEIIGIVTEFDVLEALWDGRDLDTVTAGEIMSKSVVAADLDTSEREIIETMLHNHFTVIPIVRDGKKLAGVVSRLEVMNAYVEPELARPSKGVR